MEFFGIVTRPKIWTCPATINEACDQIQAWCESPSLTILGDPPEQLPELLKLISSSEVRGSIVHDARVATCCIQHGIREFWTIDRDFSRFPALKTRNPLLQP